MYDVNKLKARIKALCAQNGMSQKFVSESTGHGQYFLNDVWQGKRAMSDGDFELAANALRTTPAYLRGETDDPAPVRAEEIKNASPRHQRVAKKIMSMDENKLEKLERILDMILEEK